MCLESISELSLSVPLLAFSKFKMAASGHIEIQQKKTQRVKRINYTISYMFWGQGIRLNDYFDDQRSILTFKVS